ncbi:MAG: endolytic transglycosylase MltG [Patescibacteria group bacterium]|jgi:UPF0755 protein
MKKLFLLVSVLFILWLGYFVSDVFMQNNNTGDKTQVFKIEQGQGVKKISERLKQDNLINSKSNFELYVWLLRRTGKIQAGDYQLNPGMSLRELVNIITYGWGVDEKTVTIVEGWNNKQLVDYLINNLFIYNSVSDKNVYYNDWNKAITNKYDYDFLKNKPAGVDLEGYLFPDTYRFYTDVEPQEVVQKMLENFNRKLDSGLREKIASRKKTIHEIITLASIIEKEVRGENDRRMVADIFWRRLDIGMPLQADSTVNYITGGKNPSVSNKDKSIDSPYNTYKNRELPPGPICNPGLEAIVAATEPTGNDYWYFLTTPEGKTVFSKTLDEHNTAKAKYLR